MDGTYRAAVLCGPENLRLKPVPIPQIGPEEVLVQVKACSLCGSDLHAYLGLLPRIKFPRVLGHEFAGVVAQKGQKVSRWQIGQRVCCSVDITCETCEPCRQGRRNLCESLETIGFERDGAYGEFVKVPGGNLHLLPDSLSFEEASMVQTLTIAYNAVRRRGEVQIQDRVVILGCGPIGLCALAVAKASGAKVYMVDVLEYRLDAARAMGADETFHGAKTDVVKSVLSLGGGKGVDKVIEAAGGEQKTTLVQATQMVKRGGTVVVAGTFADDLAPMRINEIKSRELEVRGARGDVDDFPACIDLLASEKIHLGQMISHRLKLEEVEKGLRMMMTKEEKVLKIIMTP
jgi:2-desacetyl-2-hydroxyethyl bacteriochlorophyllide A dehydrogenase